MKKIFISALAALALMACSKQEDQLLSPESQEASISNARQCGAMEALALQLQKDPAMADRMEQIEQFTNRVIKEASNKRLLPDGTIEIPVVFNVIYRTASENVSQTQLQSQIDVLNEDFGATNDDYNLTPSLFQPVRSGNTGIRFVLSAINRRSSTTRSWGVNDAMKTSSSGIAATSPSTHLNIWVVNYIRSGGQTILGYAQFPGGNAATDGVVLGHQYVGRTGTATAPFNKGRTGTHEVGHWLNLRHIWGDATCGNDQVSDTPLHNTANYNCPAAGHRSTCTGTPVEMTMNYMDYTNDACMYMYSAGQKARMQALFVSGGARFSFAQP